MCRLPSTWHPVLRWVPAARRRFAAIIQSRDRRGASRLPVLNSANCTRSRTASSAARTGPAPNYAFTSNVIEYASAAQLPEVNTLKTLFSSVAVKQDAALSPNSLTLILGSSFKGLSTASGSGSAKSAQQKLNNLAKSYGGISANANICSDAAAFEGPDSPLPGG